MTLSDGGQVTVRSLTLAEVSRIKRESEDTDDGLLTARTACLALVDPQMQPDDADLLAETMSAGDLVAISDAVAAISGLSAGADKSGVPAV